MCLLLDLFTWRKQDHVSRKHADLCDIKYISARFALGSPSSSAFALAVLSSFSRIVRLVGCTAHCWQPGARGTLQPGARVVLLLWAWVQLSVPQPRLGLSTLGVHEHWQRAGWPAALGTQRQRRASYGWEGMVAPYGPL